MHKQTITIRLKPGDTRRENGAKTLEKFRISGEGVGGGGGEGRNKYEILWIILLEGVQFGRCSPERWIFCSSFSILRSGLARGLLEFVFALARCQGN